MEGEKKSTLLVVIFWMSAIGCFIFGYYNTVKGLSTFDAFGSSAGSWFLAVIPLVMVFGGYLASVQGKKGMLALYLAGEILFFVFNLTYLYPQYLGRTLITEEAKALKDSISTYNGRFENDKIVISSDPTLKTLKERQANLKTEIIDREGFGDRAKYEVEQFNKLAHTTYTPSRRLGLTKEERQKLWEEWEEKTNEGIRNYIIYYMNGDKRSAIKLLDCKADLTQIDNDYSPKLDSIIGDNSDVSIEHNAVANNPQIALLKELTLKLDKVANDVNSVMEYNPPFSKIVSGDETIAFPKTQKLGTFEHTVISVKERINKLDTWGVIIICLFFDLLGPFLFYFYLRSDKSESNIMDSGVWDSRLWYKRFLGMN